MSLRFPCAWHKLGWSFKAVGHSSVLAVFLQACFTFCIFPLPDYPDPDNFTWEKYLKETGASAVPGWAFKVVSATSSAPLCLGRNSGFFHCQFFAFTKSQVMFSILLPQAWGLDLRSRFRSQGYPGQIVQNWEKLKV